MAGELERVVFRQCGIVTYAQAIRHLTRAVIRHKLRRGEWQKLFHGVMATHAGRLTRQQHWVASVLAAGDGAALAGVAALQAGGVKLTSKRLVVDVLVPRCGLTAPKPMLREMAVVRLHRSEHPFVARSGQPPTTTMARAVVDAAQWAPSDEEARLIVAAACQQRKVLPAEVIAAAEGQPRAKRRALVLETAAYAVGGATTLTEIDFVKLCAKHGLPRPDMQEKRKDSSGRTRYLDAYWKLFHLHLEIDGAHHMHVSHWAADMLRQNEVWLKGDRVLRFPAHMVRTQPETVMAQIRQAMLSHG